MIQHMPIYQRKFVINFFSLLDHKTTSFIKSGIRIIGYIGIAIVIPKLIIPVLILIYSELVGIVEEMVQNERI